MIIYKITGNISIENLSELSRILFTLVDSVKKIIFIDLQSNEIETVVLYLYY